MALLILLSALSGCSVQCKICLNIEKRNFSIFISTFFIKIILFLKKSSNTNRNNQIKSRMQFDKQSFSKYSQFQIKLDTYVFDVRDIIIKKITFLSTKD